MDTNSRPMIKGDWKCGGCGAQITEMPFEPAAGRPIYCRDCYRSQKSQSSSSSAPRREFSDRPMVQGNWECAGCKTKIESLPFEPAEGRPIYCRDCYKSRK